MALAELHVGRDVILGARKLHVARAELCVMWRGPSYTPHASGRACLIGIVRACEWADQSECVGVAPSVRRLLPATFYVVS